MVCGAVLVCILLGAGLPSAVGDDDQAEVRQLVQQLDAPRLADREAAEAELLRRGPAVLPLLPAENGSLPAEVQQRAGRIRQQLELALAQQAADASTITLHAKAMPLSEILEQFQRQSGNTILDYRPQFGQPVSDPKLAVDFDKTEFWPALDRLLDRAGLAVYPYAKRRAIGVVARSSRHAPRAVAGDRLGADAANKTNGMRSMPATEGNGARSVPAALSYSGPFRFEAVSIVAERQLRPSGSDALIVSVDALWEPRLRIISLVHRSADVRAFDERGRPLPVAASDAMAEMADVRAADGPAMKLDIRLQRPAREVQRIATLQGKLLATLAGGAVTFRFDNPDAARDVQRRIAGVTVTLEQVRKTVDGCEVRIRVRFDNAGDALASHRQWIFNNAAELEQSNGRSIAYSGVQMTAQAQNEVGLAYQFKTDRPLSELTFAYTTPGAIIDRTYAYELKNIDLP